MNVKHKVQSSGAQGTPPDPKSQAEASLWALQKLESEISDKTEELGLLMDQYVSEAKALRNSEVDLIILNRVLRLDLRVAERIYASRTLNHRAKLCACLNQFYSFTHWGDVL